jgi:hypothetical protein
MSIKINNYSQHWLLVMIEVKKQLLTCIIYWGPGSIITAMNYVDYSFICIIFRGRKGLCQ